MGETILKKDQKDLKMKMKNIEDLEETKLMNTMMKMKNTEDLEEKDLEDQEEIHHLFKEVKKKKEDLDPKEKDLEDLEETKLMNTMMKNTMKNTEDLEEKDLEDQEEIHHLFKEVKKKKEDL